MTGSWRLAVRATLHCLTGCAIGEVAGMVIGTAVSLHNLATIVLSIGLAFVFGYSLSVWSLRGSGLTLKRLLLVVLAADTLSITVMEVVDNGVIAIVPGALDSQLTDALFWATLALSLVVAFAAAVPVNRWLIARGQGHALVHDAYHPH